MALYYDLPVYKTGYELYLNFVKVRRTLPREERYTLGQELDRAMVELLVMVQRINSTREKIPLIARARQLAVEIQVRIRVLRDVQALSIKAFTGLFDLSESVSKQLASWQRFSQKQTISDAKVSSVPGGRPESVGSRFDGVRQTANPMREGAASSASPDSGGPTCSREATP